MVQLGCRSPVGEGSLSICSRVGVRLPASLGCLHCLKGGGGREGLRSEKWGLNTVFLRGEPKQRPKWGWAPGRVGFGLPGPFPVPAVGRADGGVCPWLSQWWAWGRSPPL